MAWQCPACGTPFQFDTLEAHPRSGVIYRCHVCHIELVLNPDSDRLEVVPLRDDERLDGD
jgi:hypothetical protein